MIAKGFPPEQTIFLAASLTAIAQPIFGSELTYLGLQSTVNAKALFVFLIFSTELI